MVKKIELDIILSCNLNCHNCDRACGICPSDTKLEIDDINNFIEESYELNITWDKVAVLGGEPTLHPKLKDILSLLDKKLNHRNKIILKTNGYGSRVKEVLKSIPSYIDIVNTHKESKKQHFSTFNIAPIDIPEYKNHEFSEGCIIPYKCGLCFNGYGYFCCGAGATIDRIFKLNTGVQNLKDLTDDVLKHQKSKLCRFCGHIKDRKIHGEYSDEQKISQSWREALIKYK